MKTRVTFVWGGPSGLSLSQLLHTRCINSVILKHKTKNYVLARICTDVLEEGLEILMEHAGRAYPMHAEGLPNIGTLISASMNDS